MYICIHIYTYVCIYISLPPFRYLAFCLMRVHSFFCLLSPSYARACTHTHTHTRLGVLSLDHEYLLSFLLFRMLSGSLVCSFARMCGVLSRFLALTLYCDTLQHTATHCNILQHTATHCNTLQLTATHCNTLQHTATHCNTRQLIATHRNTLQLTATHCNSLQHIATHGYIHE